MDVPPVAVSCLRMTAPYQSDPPEKPPVALGAYKRAAVSVPPASVACGKDSYDGPVGSTCSGDLCRRVVTTIVRVDTL